MESLRFLKFLVFVFKFENYFLCRVRDSTTNKPSELTWSWHPLACLPKLPLIRHSAGWDSGQSIILLPQSQQHLCLYEPWDPKLRGWIHRAIWPKAIWPYESIWVQGGWLPPTQGINLRYLNVEFLGCKLNSVDFDGIMKRIVFHGRTLGIASLQPLAFSHLHCVWGILVAFRMWIWNLTDLTECHLSVSKPARKPKTKSIGSGAQKYRKNTSWVYPFLLWWVKKKHIFLQGTPKKQPQKKHISGRFPSGKWLGPPSAGPSVGARAGTGDSSNDKGEGTCSCNRGSDRCKTVRIYVIYVIYVHSKDG